MLLFNFFNYAFLLLYVFVLLCLGIFIVTCVPFCALCSFVLFCVEMCTVLLQPGVKPIVVNEICHRIISYHIYHVISYNVSYRIISHIYIIPFIFLRSALFQDTKQRKAVILRQSFAIPDP
jgi:hypothetical protein